MIQCQCVEHHNQPLCSPGNSTSNGWCTSWCIGSARTRSITKAGISPIHETTGAAWFSHRFRYTKSGSALNVAIQIYTMWWSDSLNRCLFWAPRAKVNIFAEVPHVECHETATNCGTGSFTTNPFLKDFLKPLSVFWKILAKRWKGTFWRQ